MTDGIKRLTDEELEKIVADMRPPTPQPPYAWQGMESVPMDGHPVDLWITYSCFGKERGQRVTDAYWSERRGEWQYPLGNPVAEESVRITHWMRIGKPNA